MICNEVRQKFGFRNDTKRPRILIQDNTQKDNNNFLIKAFNVKPITHLLLF